MKKQIFLLFPLIVFIFSCNEKMVKPVVKTVQLTSLEKKVESLLAKMTLQEKVGQMNQYNGFWDVTGPIPEGDAKAAKKHEHLKTGLVGSMLNVRGAEQVRTIQELALESRLKIPLIIGFDVIHGYRTISPIPLAETASWDIEAIQKSAEVAAREAAASGVNWAFAPMVDISRDARWGRVMEGGGEDPFLCSEVSVARVKGFQGNDLASVKTIAACAKHFAAYGFVEGGKEYNTVDISMATLHNTVLPPFKAVAKAGVETYMNAFNELNGIPATGSVLLQRDILKGDWNFDGFVLSDWGSIGEMVPHGFAKDNKDAALKAVIGGSDMDMESNAYVEHLADLVTEGKVKESLIDDAVRRILTLKFKLGLFDDPYKYCDVEREKEEIGSKENVAAVLDMAKKSIVLLKNSDTKAGNKLLPLKKKGLNIAVIGALANEKNSPLGSWIPEGTPNSAVSVLEGLNSYSGNTITYKKGATVVVGEETFIHEIKINQTDKSEFAAAITAAKTADVVIMVLGEYGFQTGEGRTRTDIDLPGVQQELLEEVYKVNPNIVLVLNNGRPLAISWADENIPSIVEAWHLGSQAGNAIAQVLYGDYNPSGKLPMTFPRNVGQCPIYYNDKNTGRPISYDFDPEMVFWSHYSDVENSPLYAFGHGLSYASFQYKNLRLNTTTMTKSGSIKVSVDVTNSSDIAGEEVVQLYIRDLVGSLTRPVMELKGFEKLNIDAKETKTVSFMIDASLLEFYTAKNIWEVETGDFDVFVGGSSDRTLKVSFEVVE